MFTCRSLCRKPAQARRRGRHGKDTMMRESRKGGDTFNPDGISKTTTRTRHLGARMVQCLLKEMGLGEFETWVEQLVADPLDADGGYPAVGRMWEQLLKKVEAGEMWDMPDSRYGGSKRGGEHRPICYSHLKEIIFGLKQAINQAKEGGLATDDGHFQRYQFYKKLEPLLAKRKKEAKKDVGDEAVQRRNKCFTGTRLSLRLLTRSCCHRSALPHGTVACPF